MNLPRREQFRFFCPLATRWGDVDRIGHVNNAKYFTYDEQARIEYFRQTFGHSLDPKGSSIILARIACDFVEQLHHPAQMDYAIRIARIGRSSMQTEGALFVGERCHARTEGVVVWFDYAAQKAVPVPESVRRNVRDFEIVKPTE
ncbi:MAG: acyl-CoA thioesterase [Panacagrimonas sp.]